MSQPSTAAYEITTEPERFDLDLIHRYLNEESYWARGIPREVVERSIRHSICFAVIERASGAQVGFARVTTDRATFAYLADVFVLPPHRGRGLSKKLIRAILINPDLQGLRRWMLGTRDAHRLYAAFGFTPLPSPERFMQLHDPDIYLRRPTADHS